jgi:hypothetical protein
VLPTPKNCRRGEKLIRPESLQKPETETDLNHPDSAAAPQQTLHSF